MRGLDQHKIRKSTYPDISPESSAQLAPGSTNSEKLYQNDSPYVGDTDFLVAETGQIAKRNSDTGNEAVGGDISGRLGEDEKDGTWRGQTYRHCRINVAAERRLVSI